LDTPVEKKKLQAVSEAVRQAPFHGPNTTVLAYVGGGDIATKAQKANFHTSNHSSHPRGIRQTHPKGARGSAVVIVLCADPVDSGTLWVRIITRGHKALPFPEPDAGLMGYGIGHVFVGVYDEEKIKAPLDIPPPFASSAFPVGLIQERRKKGTGADEEATS